MVPSIGGTIESGDTLVTASVTIIRGRTESTQDSQTLGVQPTASVDLAETAGLEAGGGAVVIDIAVACPVTANGQGSYVNVSQGQTTSGNGTYLPVCNGQEHTFADRVQAAQGVYQVGTAQAVTLANIEHEGIGTAGIDEGAVQILS